MWTILKNETDPIESFQSHKNVHSNQFTRFSKIKGELNKNQGFLYTKKKLRKPTEIIRVSARNYPKPGRAKSCVKKKSNGFSLKLNQPHKISTHS